MFMPRHKLKNIIKDHYKAKYEAPNIETEEDTRESKDLSYSWTGRISKV
jgi:hypothetical protein